MVLLGWFTSASLLMPHTSHLKHSCNELQLNKENKLIMYLRIVLHTNLSQSCWLWHAENQILMKIKRPSWKVLSARPAPWANPLYWRLGNKVCISQGLPKFSMGKCMGKVQSPLSGEEQPHAREHAGGCPAGRQLGMKAPQGPHGQWKRSLSQTPLLQHHFNWACLRSYLHSIMGSFARIIAYEANNKDVAFNTA